MEDVLVPDMGVQINHRTIQVLILIVVDDSLVQQKKQFEELNKIRLNPCYSGRWSRTSTSSAISA